MKEESQIHDMRAAVRGDRERAERARLRSTENVRALYESAEENTQPESQPEPQPHPSFLSRLFGR